MKYISALFLALLVFTGPAFSQKKDTPKLKTIVIDPGHGGDKPGALGKHCKEKDLTLSVAKKFGKLIADNYPDVNIIYTRTTDVDITLAERAHIANRNHANLFISIHANSHKTTGPSGVETFVMGLSQSKANLDVAKLENADILLEDDYKSNEAYQGFDPNAPESFVMFAMFQNAYLNKSLNFAQHIQDQYRSHLKSINRGVKQAELFVLYKTTMPAVLTEMGFISNPTEEAFMMSDEGQAQIAICLYNAFATYKFKEDGTPIVKNPKIDLPGYGKNKVVEKNTPVVKKEEPKKDSLAESTEEKKVEKQESTPIDTSAINPKALFKKNENAKKEDVEDDGFVEQPKPAIKSKVVYKVQFLSSEEPYGPDAKEFRGVKGYETYQQGKFYRYTKGNVSTVREAVRIQNEIRSHGFKDAFVIAFCEGKRISLQEAREIQAEEEQQQ